jgi:hypothetical protein
MTGVSFLIDTDWVIDHLNNLSPATQRLRELEPQGIAINIITVAELWEGVIFSRDRLRSETMLRPGKGSGREKVPDTFSLHLFPCMVAAKPRCATGSSIGDVARHERNRSMSAMSPITLIPYLARY